MICVSGVSHAKALLWRSVNNFWGGLFLFLFSPGFLGSPSGHQAWATSTFTCWTLLSALNPLYNWLAPVMTAVIHSFIMCYSLIQGHTSVFLLIKFVLWQFHICIMHIDYSVLQPSFISSPCFTTLSSQPCLFAWCFDRLSFTGAFCLTTGLKLFTGARCSQFTAATMNAPPSKCTSSQ